MNRIAPAVLAGLLALAAPLACTSPAKNNPNSADTATHKEGAPVGKFSAPVEVGAKLHENKATVTVRFLSAGSDVRVDLSGVEGLQVSGDTSPVRGIQVAGASTQTFEVAFTPGAGRSHLVVAVSGTFDGTPLSKVSSFSVGEPTEAQQKSAGSVVTDESGQSIKLMQSTEAK
ncbi:hypothetical protein NVS55_13265 [Myxococcus stipitatus]|uniref:hypothetical protein n=1 Tax=Myxococcus stipitatus TaxID=83455 RepID=UPI0031455FE9